MLMIKWSSPNSFGYVSKCVDSGTTNGLLVSLQKLQEFKTDSHPLLSWYKLRPSVGNSTYQINAILLYLLMSVLCMCVCTCINV